MIGENEIRLDTLKLALATDMNKGDKPRELSDILEFASILYRYCKSGEMIGSSTKTKQLITQALAQTDLTEKDMYIREIARNLGVEL